MATYLGNASLSTAVKERVLSTFQQTVDLFKQGRTEEVIQGCGLILRMDPMFDPAKKLLEKARNASSLIDVDALLPTTGEDGRLRDARTAMAGRDFQRVLDLTTELLTEDLTNDDARVLNEQARERVEAAPFVDQFIRKAEGLAAQGNANAARQELEKARALDADHPGIRRVEQTLSAAPAAASASSSSFIVDTPAAPPGRGTAQAADFGFTFEEDKQQGSALDYFTPSAPPTPAPPPKKSPFSTDTAPVKPVTPPPGFSFDEPFGSTPPPPPPPPAAEEAPFGGFSFDAPASNGFSFDTGAPAPTPPPAPAASVGASAEFDFSTADIVTSPDDQKKIGQYLADGDRAFDSGDYQAAIDLWSRIFLIDVTNEEASHRIEKAKAKRRESDSRVDGMLSGAIAAFERRDTDGARAKLNDVLRIDPNNATALDYMDRLNETVTEGGAGAYEKPYIPPTPPSTPTHDIFDDDLGISDEYQTPLVPPESAKPAAKPKAAPAPAPAKPRARRGAPIGAIVTVLVVVLLGAAGWFGWQKFKSKPTSDPALTQSVFTQAASLGKRGKFDQAIAMLRDIKPEDPQHDKALQMIADLQAKKAQASELINGRPAAEVFQEILNKGKAAFDAHDYAAAKAAFDEAAHIKTLPPDVAAIYDQAVQQSAKLEGAKALFNERKYQDAIASLTQLEQSDPQNASIKRMITDAHFNLGAQGLQDGRLPDAMREFDEVLKADPADELARRSRTLAERYNGQPKDLLYQIYVKYLPMRNAQ